MTATWLTIAGGAIFVVLGVLHGFYALLDCFTPRRFAPANAALLDDMKKTRIRLRKDVRNFWLSYLGFNFTHSLGVVVFGGAAIALAIAAPASLASAPLMIALVGVALLYALLSHLFFFIIPLVSASIAAALFALAAILQRAA